jgi:NADPH oxidase
MDPTSPFLLMVGTVRYAPRQLFSTRLHSLPPSQATNKKLSALNGLKFSVWTSRGAGLVLAYDGGLILVPMLRNIIRIIRPKLTWLFPADENIWFHRQVAYSMAFWAMIHATAHYINFINVERTRTLSSDHI